MDSADFQQKLSYTKIAFVFFQVKLKVRNTLMGETLQLDKSKPSYRPANIILVGLSGAGKTCIGQNLAWQLGFGFCDIDNEIEIIKKKKLPEFSLKMELLASVT